MLRGVVCALLLVLFVGTRGVPPILTVRVGNLPAAAALVDVNGDGFGDLLVANSADGTVSVLLGDGRGGFAPAPGSPFPAGESPADIAVADFDGDGHLDLAFANHGTAYVTLLFGDGHGRFLHSVRIAVRSQPHPHGIVAGDWNGDGRPALAIDSFAHDQIEVLHNDGARRFHSAMMLPTGHHPYERLRAADLLHRGRPDLVVADYEGSAVTILRNEGGGAWKAAPPVAVPRHPFSVAACDVNRDGHLDLVVSHYSGMLYDRSDDGVSVLLGDGQGHFRIAAGSPFRSGGAPVAIACADFVGDGYDDVATANSGSDSITLRKGGRERMGTARDIAVGRTPSFVAAGRLRAGEPPRLVVVDSADNDVRILALR
jgi:hypothetical protein